MSKSWQEILREHVAAAQLTPEQRERAALVCHEALHRKAQAYLAEKGDRPVFNLPLCPDESSGTVSREDIRACMEQLRQLSDEDLKRAGMQRIDGLLVFSDFTLNIVGSGDDK